MTIVAGVSFGVFAALARLAEPLLPSCSWAQNDRIQAGRSPTPDSNATWTMP
jgi:hypothetical protein